MGLPLKRTISELKYRMTLRKSLLGSSTDELRILREELNRETERRTKKK